ncbi:protein RRP6-like protein 3 isoform X2 [Cinnamomum micranthum f. kanehirae]|uniref:Protein RRP6-like protein 3 isoform X2 n=1 Tax=Cinnamomum micranthum f. kanehirae TaxID=337451 RepID=A0A443PCE4_9MAGN|nr:protein RRP6-like protein 3 isoform X2 [Cinnamomum micranthum f. kanehirae]
MDQKKNIKAMLAITCFATISVFAVAIYYRRKKLKQKKKTRSLCCSDWEKKPQNSFKRILADNSYSPFKHLKREGRQNENSNRHPYEDEITVLLEHPSLPLSLNISKEHTDITDSYVWVDTISQLEALVDLLSKEQVFSVDTEQHSLHSFLGFTALMQISTQKKDYLLDTIALHDMMGVLRPVFADPSICKVFHGADNDVLWLQRDFHIYVVNLFDTARACEVLSKPHKSLAYLLETYCAVSTNKMLQREDWRQRPLSGEMVQYARADAHYLLYIAYCLVSELKTKGNENSDCPEDQLNFVLDASRRSNMACLQLYMKDSEAFPGESAAASIVSRSLNGQGSISLKRLETMDLVRKLCAWRDLMARIHDESLRFVLSDQAIVSLAVKIPKTPTEMHSTISKADQNLDSLNVASPLPSPSPIAYSHLMEFFHLLLDMTDSSTDDIFQRIIEKHLGTNGSCVLSAYNYLLLSKSSSSVINRFAFKENGVNHMKQTARKNSRELFVQKFSCKSPVYHNCRIYASDGRLLCYCDRRKLEWYLHRDLAKLIDNDPPAIMLLFEPKGRPEDEDNDFYIQSKKNVCVGCGEKNHYLRYRIIPSCYRMHFPEHLKSHRSHDIVLLCVDCHEIAHSAAEKYKKQISVEFGIPLFIRSIVDSGQNHVMTEGNLKEAGVSPLQLRTAAMALLRHGSRMPPKRREELILIVRAYFGGREISDGDLETALLVGMSPQERRRFHKKRGLSDKPFMGGIISKRALENNSDIASTSPVASKNADDLSIPNCRISEDKNILLERVDTARDSSTCCREEDNLLTNGDENAEAISDHVDGILDPDSDNYLIKKPGDATYNSSISMCHGTVSSKYAQKLSLLGHGPHGKLVVEQLLQEHGDDGIRQFCQRWRQVFVEAIHPRFLPAGWDIKHSGRRDFGEYSVYNPAKRQQKDD